MKALILILILILAGDTHAQLKWVKRYDGPAHSLDYAADVQIEGTSVYVAGSSWGQNTNADFVVALYHYSTGALQNVFRYNAPYGGSDNANSIVVDDAGTDTLAGSYVFATGSVNNGNTSGVDILTTRLSNAGNLMWMREYTGAGDGNDQGLKAMTDYSSNVYVMGVTTTPSGDFDIIVIKYSKNGNEIWRRQYESPQTQMPKDMYVDKNTGEVFITGYTNNFLTNYLTLMINSQGNVVWTKIYNGTASQEDIANSIGHNIYNGDLYITGKCQDINSGVGITTICYSKTGIEKWVSRYSSLVPGGSVEGYDVEYAGNIIYVSGWGNVTNMQQHKGIVLGIDTTGALKWSESYASRNGSFNSQNVPSDMKIDNWGNAHISATGFDSAAFVGYNFMYVFANANGYLRTHEYHSTFSDFTSAIAIDQYNVVITGKSDTAGQSSDMLTTCFNNKGHYLTRIVPKNLSSFSTEWDSLNVPRLGFFGDASNIYSVKVILDTIIFPQTGDLEIYLEHNGTVDTLVYHNGGSGDNFIATELSDTAAVPITNGTAPFTGSFKPKNPLSVFSGAEVSGLWMLRIKNTGSFTGTLRGWTLIFEVDESTIGIHPASGEIPDTYSISQNYPNPFNPVTNIKFSIPKGSMVTLKIYNILGKEVATLVNQNMKAGTYNYDFNASHLPSGVYFYRMISGDFTETRKMILVK